MTARPATPLTVPERDRLQHLIRRAARHLGAEERGSLLRLWERQQAAWQEPCTVAPPSLGLRFSIGPCLVTGPHVEHRNATGTRWRAVLNNTTKRHPVTDHYAEQVRQQLAEARTERDCFAAGVPLICSDERHSAKVRGLEELLVAGQKATTYWEGAYASEVSAHGITERALSAAEARIAAVREVISVIGERYTIPCTHPDGLDFISVGEALRRVEAALDGDAEQPADDRAERIRALAARIADGSPWEIDPVRDAAWRAMVQLGQDMQGPAES